MLEGGEGNGDIAPQVNAPFIGVEQSGQAGSGVFDVPDEITAPGGEVIEDERLFALRMPHPSSDQLRVLGSLAAAFDWDLVPVKAPAATDADTDLSAVVGHALAEVKQPTEDPETVAYLEKYVGLKGKLDNVSNSPYATALTKREPFTDKEKQAFTEAGYKSVVELTTTFGEERATVYAYEDAPGLPEFKVTYLTHENNIKQRPADLRTFTFSASGGTVIRQRYVYKSFGRIELPPPTEENQEPMGRYDLDNLSKLLFRENFALVRVRNGTWQRGND
jgi:hypothetical protein